MLNTLLPFFGNVPPPAPPVASAISLSPANPGDLGLAPASWTTRVTATNGLTQIKWTVGILNAKTIEFSRTANNVIVPGYNHGDVINFTDYGTGFTLVKDPSGPNTFLASGSLGSTTFTIGSETALSDVRFTVAGTGGTGPIEYTLVNLTNGIADIQPTFYRPGDSLIVKNVDETISVNTAGVIFSGAGVKSITMTPQAPGDLVTNPASWTTRINAVGLTQVQWIVLDTNWAGSGTTEFTVVNLINGTAQITCTFLKAGDRLVVKSMDQVQEVVSEQVTFSQAARSLSMNPVNPGNLGTAPVTWETTVTAVNMASFEWAVRNSDNSWATNWFVAPVTAGTAVVRPTFTASGQRLVISTPDNTVRQESGQVSFNVAPSPSGDDYAFANDFVKNLTMGINFERGTGIGEPLSYFTKLKNDSNATHLRFFPPSRPDWGLTPERDIGNMCDTFQTAISAGFKIIFAPLDVIAHEFLETQQCRDYINMCWRVVQARNFDPRYFTMNSWNELGEWTNDATPFNATRIFYKDLARQYFPNHVICTSGPNWGAWEATIDPSLHVFDDKRMLYEWHSYPWNAEDVAAMQAIGDALATWKAAKGVVTINGEIAQAGETGGTEPQSVARVTYSSSRGMWRERPTMWTITGAGMFRMNAPNTNDLEGYQADALRDADAYIRAQPGFGT